MLGGCVSVQGLAQGQAEVRRASFYTPVGAWQPLQYSWASALVKPTWSRFHTHSNVAELLPELSGIRCLYHRPLL